MSIKNITYGELNIGDADSLSLEVTAETVNQYARLIGDVNPVHLDEDFAAKSFFRKRVAHGMIAAGLVSAVLGTRLPGPGAIYLSQSLEFKRPVYLGETITAKAEVIEKDDRHKKAVLRTWVENSAGEAVLEGQAVVLVR